MSESQALSKKKILQLLEMLNTELATVGVHGEVYLVGGAVMCLALNARAATKDVDAWLEPTRAIREAASRVASKSGVEEDWLNDAVKGWLSPRGEFDRYLELTHLQVFVARPEYLLAMKSVAMRMGDEFADVADVRYLLRYLNITSADAALEIIARYFDESQIPVKTRLAIEELVER